MKLLQQLFAQKSWANQELFAVLADLDPVAHADCLHMAVRMLNHIHVVDRIFRAHLLGEAHGYTSTNTEATPSLEALHFETADTDAWFERYVAQLSAEQMAEKMAERMAEPLKFQFTDGDSGRMSREEMLMHLITHGAYHRGNVGQMLKAISVAPPRDLLTKFLHLSEPQRRLP